MDKFQSHAGSIEAPLPQGLRSRLRLFQSHAGSIEAGWGVIIWFAGFHSFNPTLVRLRLLSVSGPNSNQNRFNPTLVRLRRSATASEKSAIAVVSIPRWFD